MWCYVDLFCLQDLRRCQRSIEAAKEGDTKQGKGRSQASAKLLTKGEHTCILTKAMLRMLTAVLPPSLTLCNLQTRRLRPVKL